MTMKKMSIDEFTELILLNKLCQITSPEKNRSHFLSHMVTLQTDVAD